MRVSAGDLLREVLHAALVFDSEFEQIAERLGTYAFLKTTEDQANSKYQALKRVQNLAVMASYTPSFMPQRFWRLMQIPSLSCWRMIDLNFIVCNLSVW